ncbi:SGNH/GDSL hydrolase family protein [Leptospira sp. GIMC2001]|uniref:SGNH/GDSL hydrolase family protein n=1 Tax=Leptospira sp. GIMC2001 TaxID=1513297 RepID=UPI00234A65B7|nr:SGNH/GDSL hydrolase family protein [Leptospira sp. GIMC2001]WCL48208.1 SGNH/GDSL hydrolase family protein [Leptospira sp. GIMC2001]
MLRKLFFYIVLFLLVFCAFRMLDYVGFYILKSQNFSKVSTYPANTKTISFSSDFIYLSETNSLGIRNEELSEKSKTRVLFIGDSFVHGVGVKKEQTMVSLVSEKFRKLGKDFEFINAGIIGNSPLQSRLMYEYLNPIISPDVVVFCIYTNDVFDSGENQLSRKTREFIISHNFWLRILNLIFPNSLEYGIRIFMMMQSSNLQADANSIQVLNDSNLQSQNLSKYKRPQLTKEEADIKYQEFISSAQVVAKSLDISSESFDDWKDRLGSDMLHSAAIGDYNSWHVLYGLTEPSYFKDSLELNEQALNGYNTMIQEISKLKIATESSNQRFILVYVSSELQFSPLKQKLNERLGYLVDSKWLQQESELEKRLIEYSIENGIPFLTLTDSLRLATNSGKTLTWDFDLHWNAAGNRVAADAISPFLLNELKNLK